jgi:hypothetical protein
MALCFGAMTPQIPVQIENYLENLDFSPESELILKEPLKNSPTPVLFG